MNKIIFPKLVPPELRFVNTFNDFGYPQNGAYTLEDNVTYFILCEVDLLGYRLIGGQNSVLIGGSSENCILKSTGLSANTALITSQYSLPMRNITITHGLALDLDASDNSDQALDWFGVNFTNCAEVGRIANYNNFIMTDCALLNSSGLEFDGAIGTVGFVQCLFNSSSNGTALTFASTLTITRRIRVTYSSFVTLSGETSINTSVSATIPVESYILDTVNFSGGGTYISGVQYSDNKSLFTNCVGINNTSSAITYYMLNNATATVVSSANVEYKILGTTTSSGAEKFSHTDNKATYTGALTRKFKVTCMASLTSGNNNQIGLYVAKNGTVIPESEVYSTSSGTGRAENIGVQVNVTLSENDYIEMFAENATSATNITVTFMNVIITEV